MESGRFVERTISSLKPGDHLCYFFDQKQERRDVFARFLHDGLRQGQQLFYFYRGNDPETVINDLRDLEPSVHRALERCQLILCPCGTVSLDALQSAIENSQSVGYSSIRVVFDMNEAAVSAPERLVDLEVGLAHLAADQPAVVLCFYDRRSCPPGLLMDALLVHPHLVMGEQVLDNRHYLPPEVLLGPDREAALFETCLSSLTSREQRAAELQHEIHERQQVEAVLRESEGRYRALVNQSPLSILVAQDGHYVFANPAIVQRLGYDSAYELVGKSVVDIMQEAGATSTMRPGRVLNNEQGDPAIMALKRKDGSVYFAENTTVPILYQGRPAVLWIGQDVTERMQYEQQLEASLAEKEVILREIHHRVKNNLNVIIALIDLQKASQTDPQVLQVFKELQTRAFTMALVHESLYRSPNLARIDFSKYLQTLVNHLYSAYAPTTIQGVGSAAGAPFIEISLEIQDVALNIETAIPCGLIVNELVTNALKYGFPPERVRCGALGCRILVRLEREPSQEDGLLLTVSDNGAGLPPGFDWGAAQTLGMQLVQVLARQLGGKIDLVSDQGLTWQLTFVERKV